MEPRLRTTGIKSTSLLFPGWQHEAFEVDLQVVCSSLVPQQASAVLAITDFQLISIYIMLSSLNMPGLLIVGSDCLLASGV